MGQRGGALEDMVAPRILIIGVGHFGRAHLEEWLILAEQGTVEIAGLVVESNSSQKSLQQETSLRVHVGFDIRLLDQVDAVDIVTPASTHHELVKACLPHVDVLVEKPLCESQELCQELFQLAQYHQRILMVGHIYRFHPLTNLVKKKVDAINAVPELLQVTFSNPREGYRSQEPFLEWIHIFDLMNTIFPSRMNSCHAWRSDSQAEASFTLQNGLNAVLRCGWSEHNKQRQLILNYPDVRLIADYIDGALIVKQRHKTEKQFINQPAGALRNELKWFLQSLRTRNLEFPSAQQVGATMELAIQARSQATANRSNYKAGADRRPSVAIIGGGIFGAAAAIELGKDFDVTLFERHDSLLTEASFLNQWRHHSGFHYPRSIETILEVQKAKSDFEEEFEEAIERKVDAYFAVSAYGKEISGRRYRDTCRVTGLNFKEVSPPAGIVYPGKLQICLKTDEAIVNIPALITILMKRLSANPCIKLRLNSEVSSGKMTGSGHKQLVATESGKQSTIEFDYLVNATYANSNLVSHWFGFPLRPLRFDRLELAVYQIPGAPQFMMTLIDAPFTSLTSLGHDDLFMLSHIHHSVLASEVTANGLPPDWQEEQLNYPNLLNHGLRYLPILKNARYVESRVGTRTVTAYSEDFDGRPTVVVPHGFGCWSILGGKITTAVTNAREIHRAITKQYGIGPAE